MNQYITVKGVYEKGTIRLLEVPDKNLVSHSEVMIMIPLRNTRTRKKSTGIPISNFSKKINLFAIGGDSIKETEDLFND
jgi:hypothetical protein